MNFYRRLTVSIFVANIFFSFKLHAAGPSGILLQTYGHLCPGVVTRHVEISLSQVNQLIHSIQRLQTEAQCFGAEQLLDVANRFQNLHEDYLVYAGNRAQQQETSLRVQEYSSLLASGQLSANQEEFVKESIFQSQTELIHIGSREGRFDNFHSKYARGANELTVATENFLSSALAQPLCRESSLNFWSSIVSNSLMVASSFVAPGASIALAAGGVLTKSLGHFMRNIQYNQSYRRIHDFQFPTALRCVSEALSEQYCETSETQQLIEYYQSTYNSSQDNNDGRVFWGIELLTRQILNLDHWLKEVLAGSAITSEGDLVNRETPIIQFEFLQKVRRYLETFISTRNQLFSSITNPLERSQAIGQGVTQLVSIMGRPNLRPSSHPHIESPGGVEHPIFITREIQVLPFALFDPSLRTVPSCVGDTPCIDLNDYIAVVLGGRLLSFDDWQRVIRNAFDIIDQALVRVNLERARTVAVDPFSVFVRANSDHQGEMNVIEGLKSIIKYSEHVESYLQSLESHRDYTAQITNIHKTRELTETVLNLILEAFHPRQYSDDLLPPACRISDLNSDRFNNLDATHPANHTDIDHKSFMITSCITHLLMLAERGNDVFFTKIRDLVQYEVEAKLRHNDFSTVIEDILRETRDDLVTSLSRTYSNTQAGATLSLDQILTGLETSKDITAQTAGEFGYFFRDIITGVTSVSSNFAGQRQIADYCFRLLPFLDEENSRQLQTVYNACKDVTLNFYDKGPTLVWSDFIKSGRRRRDFAFAEKATFYNRMCNLRDYYRTNKLIDKERRRERLTTR